MTKIEDKLVSHLPRSRPVIFGFGLICFFYYRHHGKIDEACLTIISKSIVSFIKWTLITVYNVFKRIISKHNLNLCDTSFYVIIERPAAARAA